MTLEGETCSICHTGTLHKVRECWMGDVFECDAGNRCAETVEIDRVRFEAALNHVGILEDKKEGS